MANRKQATVNADLQDVRGSHNVTRGDYATLTAIYPSLLASPPAYGTRLRAVRLINFNGSSRLVVEKPDDLGITRLTYLLSLLSTNALRCIIERPSSVALCVGEGIGNLARGLVHDVVEAMAVLRQYLGFATLQAPPPTRTLRHAGLLGANTSQELVSKTNNRLSRTPTDKDSLLTIAGRDQRIDTEVNSDGSLHSLNFIVNFADDQDAPKAQTGFDQTARKLNRNPYAQLTTLATGQCQDAVFEPSRLIGVDDIAILGLAPRVAHMGLALFAQPLDGLNGLTKLSDNLLNRLRVQPRILAFGPLLPAFLGGPSPVGRSDSVMSLNQVPPEPSSLLARGCEHLPLGLVTRHPGNLYRTITHTSSVAFDMLKVKGAALHLQGLKPRSFRSGRIL